MKIDAQSYALGRSLLDPSFGQQTEGPRIKGSALLGVLAWLGEHFGREVRTRIIAAVEPPWVAIFTQPIRGSQWYPYATYAELLRHLESFLASSKGGFTLRDVGRYGGRRDLGGVLKIVAAFTSVEAGIARGFGTWGPSYWSRFCDAGSMRLVSHHHRGAAIALDGFSAIAPQHCQLMEGWWEAMAEATGARDVEISQSFCVHRGDDRCEFVGTWS